MLQAKRVVSIVVIHKTHGMQIERRIQAHSPHNVTVDPIVIAKRKSTQISKRHEQEMKRAAANTAARIHQDKNPTDPFAYGRAHNAVMQGIFGLSDFLDGQVSV